MKPFDLVLRFKPEMRMNLDTAMTEDSHNPLKKASVARQEIEMREKDDKLLRNTWDASQIQAKKYYDKYRKEISFAKGDDVLINVKNLRVRRSCKKLINRYVGSFKVIKSVGHNAYELDLSEAYGRLYRTFSVSLFEPYVLRED